MTPIERLLAVVNDPKYQEFTDELVALRGPFFDSAGIYAHLDGVAKIMPRLRDAALQMQPPEPEQVEPDPEGPEPVDD